MAGGSLYPGGSSSSCRQGASAQKRTACEPPQQIVADVSVDQQRVEEEVRRKACFIVGTNVLDPAILSNRELVRTDNEDDQYVIWKQG